MESKDQTTQTPETASDSGCSAAPDGSAEDQWAQWVTSPHTTWVIGLLVLNLKADSVQGWHRGFWLVMWVLWGISPFFRRKRTLNAEVSDLRD